MPQSEPLYQWRSRPVRDLAWCIGSPPLVVLRDDQHQWPDEEWYRLKVEGFASELKKLDTGKGLSREEFDRGRDNRLGAWFEFLMANWLKRDGRYSLLARNVAVRRGLRKGGRETLGEMDFIVRDQEQNLTEHWEVAVKFYLGRPAAETNKQWVGPGQKDRLDIKLARIRDHQLPLSATPGAKELLAREGIVVDRSRVIIKGRLFYPLHAELQPPANAAPGHLRGWWLRLSDFADTFASKGWRWRRLTRREWLSPVNFDDNEADRALALDEFAASADIQQASWPRMLVAFDDRVEVSRGFVVPDGWGRNK